MTRRDLLNRADDIEPVLARHGVRINRRILEDSERTISTALYGEMLPLYVARHRRKRAERGILGRRLDDVAELLQRTL